MAGEGCDDGGQDEDMARARDIDGGIGNEDNRPWRMGDEATTVWNMALKRNVPT